MLISRDINTVPAFAHERVATGPIIPDVFVLPPTVSMAAAVDDLALIAGATESHEWVNRVVYLPLR